ncbi:MAG: 4-(cytidine 5'-diphospho)-2-C-methyl-D-erythritol kinase [Silvibacterium sp.]|nr:4-(cytidine 5'-diphospho)-2-C-methyl-D-erythritol kinase [Silvibacterium sp.]
MSTTVRSFAKINLGLAIGPGRPDGFHSLTTLYQTIAVHDLVTVEARPAGAASIVLTSDDGRVPLDERNTAFKSVKLALESKRAGVKGVGAEVRIHINKRLPVQGGLGAGSANAVAALIGLERELRAHCVTPLSGPERLRIAAQVGSDVPLFLIGGAVLGVGRGEEVYPMPDLPVTLCVVALPEIGVSTPQAFRDWDARHDSSQGGGLTEATGSDRLNVLSRALASALCDPYSSGVFQEDLAAKTVRPAGLFAGANPLHALVRTGIENDFEEVVFPQNPLFGEIKRVLAGPEDPEVAALYVSLSGSGSALFGLYGSQDAAASAVARLDGMGVRSLLTETMPRERYWRSLIVE